MRDGLLPAPRSTQTTALCRWSPEEPDHALLTAFKGGRNGDLDSVRFTRIRPLPASDPSVPYRTLMSFPEGRPALIEVTRWPGRLLVAAFSLDEQETDLPKHPCFVPLIHSAARYLSGVTAPPSQITSGTPVAIDLDPEWDNVRIVSRLRGSSSSETLQPEPGSRCALLTDLIHPGLYDLTAASPHAERRSVVAVNTDPEGSDLRRIPVDEIRSRFPNRTVTFSADREEVSRNLVESRRSREWAPWLLAALTLLLLGETGLANRWVK
jgi:hypothetical protein